MIRVVQHEDAAAIAAIYNHYIRHTVITFEETAVTAHEMRRRIDEAVVAHPWLVDEADGHVTGYAYASQWHRRSAYRHTAETTVYLDHKHTGRGIGRALYTKLLDDLRSRSLHAAIGGIALPNPASVALHESFGFRKVAHYREVGRKLDRWIDVGYWQLML